MDLLLKTGSTNPTYSIQNCGFCAARIIAGNSAAQVIGVTNKGIFIETEDHQILFISGEAYCGPLTLNLASMINFKSLFSQGEKCALQKDQIAFELCIILFNASTPIWQPSPIFFAQDSWQAVNQRSSYLASALLTSYQDGMFLPFLTEVSRRSGGKNTAQVFWEEYLCKHLPGFETAQTANFPQRLLGLIGLGSGLTPSGDDFLVGFLLASHYLVQLSLSSSQTTLQNQIVKAAKQKTTTLSAALIKCAADGAADERLMKALGWLAQGGATISEVKTDLLSYGSSSGTDSFAGMLAAILLFSPIPPDNRLLRS